jgi:hypothetical protein
LKQQNVVNLMPWTYQTNTPNNSNNTHTKQTHQTIKQQTHQTILTTATMHTKHDVANTQHQKHHVLTCILKTKAKHDDESKGGMPHAVVLSSITK